MSAPATDAPQQSRWSWEFGEYFGISLRLHVSFAILLGWITWATWAHTGSVFAALYGLLMLSALFACVAMHEYGHALMARHFGIGTREITLFPIGGVAQLERMPDEPRKEFWIAVAGPAVNVALAVICAVLIWLQAGTIAPIYSDGWMNAGILPTLLRVNVIMALFNMLPALPMDGARRTRPPSIGSAGSMLNSAMITFTRRSVGRMPAVNVALAVICAVLIWLQAGTIAPIYSDGWMNAGILPTLLRVNVIMALFNMLPALPMDGGRVLRALLALRMPLLPATRLSTRIAKVLSAGMMLSGLLIGNVLLSFIGLFVWMASNAEYHRVVMEEVYRRALYGAQPATSFWASQAQPPPPGVWVNPPRDPRPPRSRG